MQLDATAISSQARHKPDGFALCLLKHNTGFGLSFYFESACATSYAKGQG